MRKYWMAAAILVLTLVLGVGAAFAQGGTDGEEDTPPLTPPCWSEDWAGTMGFGGQGMMGGGFGMMQMAGNPMIDEVAAALGLETDALLAELQDGQTIADIAAAQDVALEDVTAAALAAHTERVAAAVEAGMITPEQAAEMTAYMAENITAHFSEGMPFWGMNNAAGMGQMMGQGRMGRQGAGRTPARGGMMGGRWG